MNESTRTPKTHIRPPMPPDLYVVQDDNKPHGDDVSVVPDAVDLLPPDDSGDVRSFTLVDGRVDNETLAELTHTGPIDRKIFPDWVRDSDEVKSAVGDWLERRWRIAAFHLVRVHVYIYRLVCLSPYGLLRAAIGWGRWVSDAEYKDDRVLLKSNGGDIRKLKKEHRSTVSDRVVASLGALLAATVSVLLIVSLLPFLAAAALALCSLCLLGLFGAPTTDLPIIERASYRIHQAPPFTESLMLSALRQCGAEPKDARQIQVIQPPAKIKSGWEAVVSVGVEASAVIERRSRFATVVDRPENCVWLSSDPEEAAGWLRIVITRKSLRRTRIPAWPFLDGGSFNWFTDEVPLGVDETGQPVAANKAYKSTVTGGIMGSGKTVSVITSIAGQAVDPRVELHLYDLKGGTDWEPFEPIAHFYLSGSEDSDHRAVIADLQDLNRRMDQRFQTLKGLPDELKSPKTNDRLASIRRFDLHPVVVMIDETQELFEFASDAKLYNALVSRIVKKGRAVGMTVEAATQEVNKKTLPIAGLCHWRLCHSVQGHGPVDLVLGTGAYKAGFDANALSAEDRGIGYFGSGKEITVFKSYFIDPDNDDLDNVIARLKAERDQLGLLTGMAAGDPIQDAIQESTLDRVVRVWPQGTKALQWVELVNALHSASPEDYPKVTNLDDGVPADVAKAVDSLSSQLGRHGVSSTDVRSKFAPKKGKTSGVRKGVRWTDLTKAQDDSVQSEPDTDLGIDVDMPNDNSMDNGSTGDGDYFDDVPSLDDISTFNGETS